MKLMLISTLRITLLKSVAACGIIFLSSCATVSITSRPTAAEVILAVPGQEAGKVIGKTPFTGPVSDIAKNANRSTLLVTIRKAGYRPYSVVIPNLGSGKLEIDASLQPVGADDSADVNLAIRYILEAEKEIIDKNFKNALKSLDKAKAANPNIAAAHMFEGIVYQLQNDKGKAKEALIRALALDPTDTEVRSLLNEIGGDGAAPAPARKGKK
jgi:tetratricopeptide (TPR) repeat protein